MAADRIRTLRSLARDDREALQALAHHLPEPLRDSLASHAPASPRRTDQAMSRIFAAAEENRRASREPERDDRESGFRS